MTNCLKKNSKCLSSTPAMQPGSVSELETVTVALREVVLVRPEEKVTKMTREGVAGETR